MKSISFLNLLILQSLANLFLVLPAQADLLDAQTLQPIALTDALQDVQPGTVIVVSELHNNAAHHQNQLTVMQTLAERGLSVSAGLEFFEARFQPQVDLYVEGNLPEADFLKAIGWGGNPFGDYRQQALFPKDHSGFTVALNADRRLTSKVSKGGIDSLSPEDRMLLPENFTLGNAGYRARFEEVMSAHVPAAALNRYFEAQSVWDETMADSARKFMNAHPTQVLVVIVGDFHAAYFGGLPDRLKARGQSKLIVFSQVDLTGLTDDEKTALISPHPQWGPRANFVWSVEAPASK